jgi:aminoglycoside phosphotransferase (APT) family kinase protein
VTRDGLERFIASQLPGSEGVEVLDLVPVNSVGNARDPWSFDLRWHDDGGMHRLGCVMLVKAAAGQLETDLAPEFGTMRALHGTGVLVPRALWVDPEGSAFGRPFFVSERVPGVADMSILRRAPGDAGARNLALDMAGAIAGLHEVDWRRLPLLLPSVTGPGAAEAQLDHWQDVFERQRMEPHPVLAFAFRWLRAHQPVADRVTIVHGDFRLGNVLYEGDRVTALLDWEMVHLGDPVEDIAWAYRTVWNIERYLPLDDFLTRYARSSGVKFDRERLRWYRLFSEVKHAAISLTAARSFSDRSTQFIRHADRATTVPDFMAQFLEWLP